MKRAIIGAAAFLAVGLYGSMATAGVYADDLSKCLVNSSSDADRVVLAQWIFGAMAAAPQIKAYSAVTPQQKELFDRRIADVFGRLLLVDCRKETVAALKNEGVSVMETSFGVLGQVATRTLFADPATSAAVSKFSDYLDKGRMDALLAESGIGQRGAAPAQPAK
jgi:hypothetical protein